jgi:hypothetical protein
VWDPQHLTTVWASTACNRDSFTFLYVNEVYVGVSEPECRTNSGNKNRKQIIRKCVTVQVFGNDSNKSKFDSGGNQEEIEFW